MARERSGGERLLGFLLLLAGHTVTLLAEPDPAPPGFQGLPPLLS